MDQVGELLDRIQEVCPLPAAVQRVLSKIDDPHSNNAQIAAAVGLDASLSAEVLRLANSPLYARGTPVLTLADAVGALGLNELKNMATAMAMLAAFASEHEKAPALHELAIVRGALAGALARRQGVPAAIAYLAGLLAEIGALALLAVDAAGFVEILDSAGFDADARAPLELERYGATGTRLGAELLRRNAVPDTVVEAVLGSGVLDGGASAEPRPPLVALVTLAKRIAPLVHRSDDLPAVLPVIAGFVAESGLPVAEGDVSELLLEAGQQTKGMFRAAS